MSTSTITHPPETNFGTITSWLPLTTAYPIQSGCSSSLWARWGFNQTANQNFQVVAFDPGYGINVGSGFSCQPPAVSSWWETGDTSLTASGVTTRYSIGPIVCPQAYTSVGTSIVGVGSTQVACCPSGYSFISIFQPGIIGECTSPISIGATITYMMEATPANDFTAGDPVSATSTVMHAAGFVVGVPINGMNFADAVRSTTSSSSSTTSSASTSSSPSSLPSPSSLLSASTLPAPTAPSSSTSSSGLSTGAKAGIGVGVGIASIAIVALLSFFLLKRRSRDQETTKEMQPPLQSGTSEWKHELQAPPALVETGSSHHIQHEMDASYRRPELYA